MLKLVKTNKIVRYLMLMALPNLSLAHPVETISYSKALKLALHSNPSLNGAQASVFIAQGLLKQTQSAAFPQVNLELNGARTNNPLSVFGYKLAQGNASFADFGAEQYTGVNALNIEPNHLNHPGYYNNINGALQVSMTIYSGGKQTADKMQAAALLKAAQHGNEHAKNQLALQLFAAYEGYLAGTKMISLAQNHYVRAQRLVETTRSLKSQSIALESDELMAKANLNGASLLLSNAKLQTQNSLDQFRTLLGDHHHQWTPSKKVNLHSSHEKFSKLVKQTTSHNAGLLAMEDQVRAKQANITSAMSSYLPQVNLQLRHDWNSKSLNSGLSTNTIGLGASWTIFDFGGRSGAVQQTVAQAKKAQFETQDQRNQIRLQLLQLIRNEMQLSNEKHINTRIANQQRQIIRKLQERFGRGLIPLNAIVESESKLTQSKAQIVQTNYKLKLNQAQLLMLANQFIPSVIGE